MAINKVEFGGRTLIDLTNDTVSPQNLMSGETAHDRSGAPIVGTATPGSTYTAGDGIDITNDEISVDTEFTEASTRENINSGDTFSTILGKIKKWFSDLVSMFVSKSGDTMTGRLWIDEDANSANSRLNLGNSKASGTTGKSKGVLALFGKNSSYGCFYDDVGLTANRNYYIPDKSGTLALTSDIPDVSGKVNKSGDTMTGALVINRDSEAQATFSRQNTGTTSACSNITLGNNIAEGTVGSTWGRLRLWGKGGYRTDVQAPNATATRTIVFPDNSGTVALTDDLTNYVAKSGDTMSGGLRLSGSDLTLGTTGSNSDDSGDLVYTYGNGNEKIRIWTDNAYTSAIGPLYRVNKKDGTQLYYGRLATMGEVDGKVSKSGDTMTGTLNVDTIGFKRGSYVTSVLGQSSPTQNAEVYIPNANGVLAMDGDPQPTRCPRVTSKNLNNSSSIHDGASMAKFTECGPNCTNLPDSNWYFIMSFDSADTSYGAQLAIGMTTDSCWVRRKDGGSWQSWRKLI